MLLIKDKEKPDLIKALSLFSLNSLFLSACLGGYFLSSLSNKALISPLCLRF